MPTKVKRRYPVIPDKKDKRDFLARPVPKGAIKYIPDASDLTVNFPPVYDQGQQGSCTGNGWAGIFDAARKAHDMAFMDPARDFIYGQEAKLEGDFGDDNGAQVRDGAKAVSNVGVPPEKLFPYGAKNYAIVPTQAVFDEAAKHKITRYERVAATVEAICADLASGFPVIMGFTVYAAFESAAVAKSGILGMPKKGEKVLGGHCTVIVGHEVTKRSATSLIDGTFKVRNSWGAGWGQAGYFTMPFGYVAKGYVSDCWVIRSVAG